MHSSCQKQTFRIDVFDIYKFIVKFLIWFCGTEYRFIFRFTFTLLYVFGLDLKLYRLIYNIFFYLRVYVILFYCNIIFLRFSILFCVSLKVNITNLYCYTKPEYKHYILTMQWTKPMFRPTSIFTILVSSRLNTDT